MVVNTPSLNYIVVAHKHLTSGHNFIRVEVIKHLIWKKTLVDEWREHTVNHGFIDFMICHMVHNLASHEILRTLIANMYMKKGMSFHIVFFGVFIWKTRVYHVQCTWIKMGSFQPLPHQECESFCELFERVPKSAVANKQPFQLVNFLQSSLLMGNNARNRVQNTWYNFIEFPNLVDKQGFIPKQKHRFCAWQGHYCPTSSWLRKW